MRPDDTTTQANAVVDLLVRELGAELVGAYLHGSAALGRLRRSSDVDVLAVVRRTLSPAERRAVLDGVLGLSGSAARGGPARPIELAVVVQADVRPWVFPPRVDFLYGEWLRTDYENGVVPAPEMQADLAVLLTMVLQSGASVHGPPPAAVLDAVPAEDVRRASVGHVPALLEDLHRDTRNVVLTLARIWTTLATGRICAKDVAADWALDRLAREHRPVLVRARDGYLTQAYADDRWEDLRPLLRPYCDHVVRQVEACLRR